MHFRLFNKPAAFAIRNGLGLMWIDGLYEDYVAGEAYEGRVQIHGSIGLMKLEIIDSNIPPGASVYIDQVTKEVVVKWDTYTPPVIVHREVPNGSFTDDSYWEIVGPDTPARIETGWSPNGKGNLTYRDHKGEYIVHGAWAPAAGVNKLIKITGKVEHGKSSKGNASCAVGLAWYDAERNLVREDFGDPITNGGKGRWYDASAEFASSNRDIKFVRPAIKFGRKKQNHPIHIGQVEWDHSYEEGYDSDETMFVHVRVTDSVHNVAEHRGTIDETSIWVTSKLYPIYAEDDYAILDPAPVSVSHRPGISDQMDYYAVGTCTPLSITRKAMLQRVSALSDYAVSPPTPLGFARKRILVRVNAPVEEYAVNPAVPLSLLTKKHPYLRMQDDYMVNPPTALSIVRGK